MTSPLYILAAEPQDQTSIDRFFDSGDSTVTALLSNPGRLRHAGWDLETLEQPRIVRGDYLEASNGNRKTLRVYRDGVAILFASAGSNFLGWGQSPESFMENPRLNPLALIELTYNFVAFYTKLIDLFSHKPQEIRFVSEFRNLTLPNKRKIYLNPYPVDSMAWRFNDEVMIAPSSKMEKKSTVVATTELIGRPTHIAYQIIELAYLWFGIEPKKIPYVKNENGMEIDIRAIKKAALE